MIFPAIIEECDAAIDGLPNEPYRGGLIRCIAEMMSAISYRRDLDVVATELTQRDGRSASIWHGALCIPTLATEPPICGVIQKDFFAFPAPRVETGGRVSFNRHLFL